MIFRGSVAFIVLLLCTACGAGTEIGNGFKPGDGSGKKHPEDYGPDSEASGDGHDDGDGDGDGDGDTVDDLGAALPGVAKDFDMETLFTTCASPWTTTQQSDVSLTFDGAGDPTLNASYDEDKQTWSFFNPKDDQEAVRTLEIGEDDDVTIYNTDGDKISPAYECKDEVETVSTASSPATTHYSVSLIAKDADPKTAAVTTLKWVVIDGDTSTLQSISVTPPDADEPIVLNVD
jgi:hypothetical protein